MASVKLTKRFNEELTCSICLDRFSNPKVLPCLHSFCKTCLSDVIVGNSGKWYKANQRDRAAAGSAVDQC